MTDAAATFELATEPQSLWSWPPDVRASRGFDEIATASMRAVASRAAKKAGKRLRTKVLAEDGVEALVIHAF